MNEFFNSPVFHLSPERVDYAHTLATQALTSEIFDEDTPVSTWSKIDTEAHELVSLQLKKAGYSRGYLLAVRISQQPGADEVLFSKYALDLDSGEFHVDNELHHDYTTLPMFAEKEPSDSDDKGQFYDMMRELGLNLPDENDWQTLEKLLQDSVAYAETWIARKRRESLGIAAAHQIAVANLDTEIEIDTQ